ncbi:MAG TPA: MaoC/PaaZ C-terminal domain-containing protein [Candidatus Elarobacter sp.]
MNLDRLVGKTHTSDWLLIEQSRIDAFAETTEDRNPLHVDPAWCKTHSPYGVPIAHGYLTTSLLTPLAKGLIDPEPGTVVINYGLERLRLAGPVPVDSRIRGEFTVKGVEPRGDDAAVVRSAAEVFVEGNQRPVLVAEMLAYVTFAR